MHATRTTPRAEEPLGESPSIHALRREIAAVAPLWSTVLLTGETGVGKGVVARELHRRSRRPGPLVHVDCAALAPGLVESELFGHERGAFTGAVAGRCGRFELARDGTILLDEIGELEPSLQAKLLRVLQDREFERIGGTRTLAMRARVIAATSRDLRGAVQGGFFRADLYFRLAVVRLALPALRERPGDIPLLAREFLAGLARRLELPLPLLSEDFLERLAAHAWPGNARELHNALERVLIRRAGERLVARDLDGVLEEALWAGIGTERADSSAASSERFRCEAENPVHRAPPTPPGATSSERFRCESENAVHRASPTPPGATSSERFRCEPSAELIAAALRTTGGNVARAARQLGLPRTTLRRCIRRYGLVGRGRS